MDQSEVLAGMQRLQGYFQANAARNRLFGPELEAVVAINALYQNTPTFTAHEAALVLQILEVAEHTEHYNGSGWLDYVLHCRTPLRQLDFPAVADRINC